MNHSKLFIVLVLFYGFTNLHVAQVVEGDVLLTTQEEVDAFEGTSITGDLTIKGYNILNLDSLITLTGLDGSLNIIQNKRLINIFGLRNLTKFNGNVDISINDSLISLDGLNNINRVDTLNIYFNRSLLNIDGLGNVDSINCLYN